MIRKADVRRDQAKATMYRGCRDYWITYILLTARVRTCMETGIKVPGLLNFE